MRRPIALGIALLVALAGIGVFLVARGSGGQKHVSAEFPRSVSIYPGSSVRILGVPVGKVTDIKPHGTSVTVEMEYDGKYKVPAGANAAIVPPAIVGDRYIQLTPVYDGGPVMGDNASIPVQRTLVPVELDQIFGSLDKLNVALGPEGANAKGALSRLIDTGAANLGHGNGARLHSALHDVSLLIATLDDNKSDLVGVINHLGRFTTTLAQDDANVRRVNQDLASVSGQLAGERQVLSDAVSNLAVALGEVASFVHDNRAMLKKNVNGLASVTSTIVGEKRALTEFLDVAPLALSNLQNAFDPNSNSLGTRGNFDFATNPGKEVTDFVCTTLAAKSPSLAKQCTTLGGVLPISAGPNSSAGAKSLADLMGVRK